LPDSGVIKNDGVKGVLFHGINFKIIGAVLWFFSFPLAKKRNARRLPASVKPDEADQFNTLHNL
jgi:hypothetical protein